MSSPARQVIVENLVLLVIHLVSLEDDLLASFFVNASLIV